MIAVAALTSRSAHAIASGHVLDALVPFLQVFFAIWWAWMNYTWFASSFDTDDVAFRLLTMVQMAGVQRALATDGVDVPLVTVGAAGLVLVFALWWLSFLQRSGTASQRVASGPTSGATVTTGWFAALAAVGAGLETAVAYDGHSPVVVGYAIAVPVAVFLILVWALHVPIIDRPVLRPAVVPGGAAAVLLLPLASIYLPLAVVVAMIATACALVVGATVVLDQPAKADLVSLARA